MRVGIGHQDRVLGDRLDQADDVDLLVAELAERQRGAADERLPLHLARDDDHAERVGPGAEDAGDRVGGAGARRDVDRGQPVGETVVALRGHGRRLLVVHADVRQPVAAADGVVQVHRGPACHHEHVADPVRGETLRDVVGDADHRGASGSTVLAAPSSRSRASISPACSMVPIRIGSG